MKTYLVSINVHLTVQEEVEAENENQAYKIAKKRTGYQDEHMSLFEVEEVD